MTYCKPLGIISFADAEQSLQRVVTRKHESSKIRKELTANVEEDEEEVEGDQSEEAVHLGDRGLLLEVVQSRVFGELIMLSVSCRDSVRLGEHRWETK